jgi:hypothetical protein
MAEDDGTLWQVTCPCGWRARGSKAEVIQAVREHGLVDHGVETSEEEATARATRVD